MTVRLPAHLSPSQISTLDKCSAQYLLERGTPKEDREEDGAWFLKGTVAHEAIEYCITNGATLETTLDWAMDALDRLVGQSQPLRYTSKLPDWPAVVEQTERAITTWFFAVHPSSDRRLPEYEKLKWPPQTELRFYTDTKPALRLYIDAVFATKDGGYPVAIDWKTGNSYNSSPLQLQLYWWVLRYAGIAGRKTKIRAWYHHLLARDGGKIQPVDYYPGDEVMLHKIEMADRTKRQGLWDPNPSSFCSACLVQSKCPAWHGRKALKEFKALASEVEFVDTEDARDEQEDAA